jgi:hypothetical protein
LSWKTSMECNDKNLCSIPFTIHVLNTSYVTNKRCVPKVTSAVHHKSCSSLGRFRHVSWVE